MRTFRARPPTLLVLALIFGRLVLWPTLALAQQAPEPSKIGVVTAVHGQATVARLVLPQPIPLKFKDEVFLRDRFETGPRSIVRALLGGKALVTIRERSVFTFAEEPGRAIVNLESGKLALAVAKGLLKPGEAIEVRTLNAVAAVRGSLLVAEAWVANGVPQSAFTALQASVPITVAPLANPGATIPLNPNQTVGVSGAGLGSVVGPVVGISPAQAQAAAQTAEAPKAAEQSTASPLASQISVAKMAEATQLAALIAPAPTSTPTSTATASSSSSPPSSDTSSQAEDTQARLFQATNSGPTPPSSGPVTTPTTDIRVNETAATNDAPSTPSSSPPSGPPSGPPTEPPTGPPTEPPTGPPTEPPTGPPSANGPPLLIPPIPTLGPTDTLATFSGTSTRTVSSPVVQITDAQVFGPGNLFTVASGANASLAGPLAQVTGSSTETSVLGAGASVLDVQGRLQTTGELPLFVIDPTTVIAANLVTVGPTGSLVLSGPLLVDSGGLYIVSGGLLSISGGGIVTGSSPTALFQFNGSTVVTGQALSVIGSTATLSGSLLKLSSAIVAASAEQPFVELSGSPVSIAGSLIRMEQGSQIAIGPAVKVTGGSLTADTLLSSDGNGNQIMVAGTVLDLANTSVTLRRTGEIPDVGTDTVTLGLGLNIPFLRMSSSTLTLTDVGEALVSLGGLDTSNVVPIVAGVALVSTGSLSNRSVITVHGPVLELDAVTSLATAPLVQLTRTDVNQTGTTRPLVSVNPESATSSLQGQLLEATGSTIAASGPVVRFVSGTLNSATTLPLLSIDPSTVTSAQHLVLVSGTDLRLNGPLLDATSTAFRNGDPLSNVFGQVFIADGARVTSTTTEPLLSFDASSVDSSGGILSVRRSVSALNSSRLTLAGPLLTATNGSAFNTSSLGFASSFLTTPTACCSGFSVSQGAVLDATTTAPLIQLSGSTFSAGPDAQSGSHFFNVSDRVATTELIAPATVSLAGPLLGSTDSTITALFSLLRVSNSDISSTSSQPLIQLTRSTVTLGGTDPFTEAPGTARLLSVTGSPSAPASVSLHGGLLRAVDATITATSGLAGLFTQASLTTSGTTDPLISLSGGSVTTTGNSSHFFQTSGASETGPLPVTVNLSGPLLAATNTPITAGGNLVRIADGSSVSSTTTSPLVRLTGGSVTGGIPNTGGGGSLLRMFTQYLGEAGAATLSLAGPYLVTSGTTINIQDSTVAFNISDGARITSTSSAPFASFTGGSVTGSGDFFDLLSGTSFTVAPNPTVFGNGVGPVVSVPGTLVEAVNTSILATRSLFLVLNSSSNATSPPSLTVGSLIDARGSTISTGDPTANAFSFMFVADGSTVRGTGTGAFMNFDSTVVDTACCMLSLRRSPSAQSPTRMILSGPLLIATNGSSFDTTSHGFGSACCTAFFIGQAAQLSSTTNQPLIQLAGSSFNAGPDAQSGGSIFFVGDTGACCNETNPLVAPSSVTLAGPLLRATNSTMSSLFSTVGVTRSSLTSTTTSPLVDLSGSTVIAGGINPFTEALASARLLSIVSSSVANAPGSPASIALAGPVLSATNSSIATTTGAVGVFNGATFSSTTTLPLLRLDNSTLSTSAPTLIGDVFAVSAAGGPSGSGFSTASLSGPLLATTNGSAIDISGSLAAIFQGGQTTVSGFTDPFVSLTGGTHTLGTSTNSVRSMLMLFGRPAATAIDGESGLTLGTDRPIQGPLQQDGTRPIRASLLETSGATVSGPRLAQIDQALFEATAPLLNARSASVVTATGGDGVLLSFRANVTTLGSDLLRLDASTLNINSGSLVNVAGGSKLSVGGSFVTLMNGATLNIAGGMLLNVSGGSFVSISGPLVTFGGTGGNLINVTNTLVPTGYLNGVPVFSSLGGTSGFTITNPTSLLGLNSLGTIRINGTPLPSNATTGLTGSLIAIQGSGSVRIGP